MAPRTLHSVASDSSAGQQGRGGASVAPGHRRVKATMNPLSTPLHHRQRAPAAEILHRAGVDPGHDEPGRKRMLVAVPFSQNLLRSLVLDKVAGHA